MSRCIDADALEELFREVIGGIAKKPEMNGNLEHMIRASAMVIEMIKDAPTIEPERKKGKCHQSVADMIIIKNDFKNLPSVQPEIIRCRECKFASGDSRICMKFGHSPIGELDFCAWAERRTDERSDKQTAGHRKDMRKA